eukprot:515400-Prymnesium_polylepis.2
MVPVDTERYRSVGFHRRSCTTKIRLALARRKVGPNQPPATPKAGFADHRRWFLLGVTNSGSQ